MRNLLYVRYPINYNETKKFLLVLDNEWKKLNSYKKRERSKSLAKIIKAASKFRENTLELIEELNRDNNVNPINIIQKKLKLSFYKRKTRLKRVFLCPI